MTTIQWWKGLPKDLQVDIEVYLDKINFKQNTKF